MIVWEESCPNNRGCEKILSMHFPIQEDDKNELSNKLLQIIIKFFKLGYLMMVASLKKLIN